MICNSQRITLAFELRVDSAQALVKALYDDTPRTLTTLGPAGYGVILNALCPGKARRPDVRI